MHLKNRGRTGRSRDEKHVHEPDVLAQLAEQPALFPKARRPAHGFLLANLNSVNGGTERISPFFHDIRTAARPVEMMLLCSGVRDPAQPKRL